MFAGYQSFSTPTKGQSLKVKTMQENVYLIGGGKWNSFCPLLRQIYRKAGTHNPVIAYSGAANNERADFFEWARTS